jgi:hypothetical protein
VASSCECGDETSACIKGEVFSDKLTTCYLLRKDSAPWRKKVGKALEPLYENGRTDGQAQFCDFLLGRPHSNTPSRVTEVQASSC